LEGQFCSANFTEYKRNTWIYSPIFS